jgi:hypothetical protein
MLSVASRASGQLDLIPNYGDHSVVGNSTLTRTVVVQDVTQAGVVLLHEFLSSSSKSV